MHKFNVASARRTLDRIWKRLTPKKASLPIETIQKLNAIEMKVASGQPPRDAEETFLIELAEQVGA